jgi:hypothetical protein
MSHDWMSGRMPGDGQGRYATAAVCLGGHVATADVETHGARLSKFCSQCAAEIITACPSCSAPIRGHYIPPGVPGVGGVFKSLGSFCYECGKPYPWTAEKVKAAKNLTDELEGVSADEKAKLKTAIDEVAAGGPQAEAGAARIKRMFGKTTTAVGKAIWQMSVDVASEAAKKILLGN